MGSSANKGRKEYEPASKEMPVDKIREIAKTIPETTVTIKRRNVKGHMASITGQSGIRMHTLDLLDIGEFIEKRGLGGGQPFLIEARNPTGDEPFYVAKFELWVEGSPLNPRNYSGPAGSAPNGGQQQQMMMTPYGPVPMPFPQQPPEPVQAPGKGSPGPWENGLSPTDRAAYQESQMRPMYPYPPPYSPPAAPSDATQVVLRELADTKRQIGQLAADLKAAHEKNEAMARESGQKLDEMRREADRRERELKEQHERELRAEKERREIDRQRYDDDRRRQEERERERERAALEARIAAASESKGNPMQDFMMMMMQQSQTRSSSEMQMQMKLAELQSSSQKEQFAALMQLQQANKSSDEFMLKMLEQKSPGAQAELLGTIMEMQMTMTGAMMNLVQSTAGENPPPWMQMALAGLESVQNIAENIGENMRAERAQQPRSLPARPAQRALPPQTQSMPADPGDGMISMGTVEIDETGDAAAEVTESQPPVEDGSASMLVEGEEPPTPEEIVEDVDVDLEHPEREKVEAEVDRMGKILPADFRTVEWRTILVELHLQADVDKTADLIVGHLEHMMRFRGLPKALEGLREEPKKTLRNLLRWLPINSKAPAYVESVLDAVVAYLTQDGFVQAVEAEPEEK